MSSKFSASIQINAVSNLGKVAAGITKSTKTMREGFRKLSSSIKISTDMIGKFAKRASLAFIGVGFAIGALIKKTANYGDELDKTSIKTGITVEALQRLRLAAGLGGASAQDMNTGIRILSRGMDEASQGTQEYKEVFDRLMLSVTDATGNLKEPDAMLLEIADRFRDMNKAGEKMAIAQQLFGRGGSALIPMLEQGSEAIVSLGDNLQDVLTKEDTDKAFKFNDSLLILTTNIQNLTRKALIPSLPILQGYFDKINQNLPAFSAWVQENVNFEEVFAKIEAILKKVDLKKIFEVSVDSIKTIIDDLKVVLTGLREIVEFVTGETALQTMLQGIDKFNVKAAQLGAPALGGNEMQAGMNIRMTIDQEGRPVRVVGDAPAGYKFESEIPLTIPLY